MPRAASLRHELGHDGAAGFSADGLEVFADEGAHRFATQVVLAAEMFGEPGAELVHLGGGGDGFACHVVEEQAEALGGELGALEQPLQLRLSVHSSQAQSQQSCWLLEPHY